MDRFLVEADRRPVGVAVRVPGGFRFFSSDPEFRAMDSKIFPRARALTSRVQQLARMRRSGIRAPAEH
ncbi:hypothetical protein [Sphingomonas sp. IC4-52]|uniref:hypothetical protein n=1 Tax=Sphingomonas sp. IC4-52 TaxID=2887202 RepID=UPI001D116978|nr:hypothetical protein [Sphingomonas sp. IC4-52]MCC2981194.1 hypothetical protein [Sphingomonas sp. IC4-52]